MFFLFCRLPHLCKWRLYLFQLLRLKHTFIPFCTTCLFLQENLLVLSLKYPYFDCLLLWSLLPIHLYFSLGTLKYLITSLYASVIAFLQIILHIAATVICLIFKDGYVILLLWNIQWLLFSPKLKVQWVLKIVCKALYSFILFPVFSVPLSPQSFCFIPISGTLFL